MANSPRSASASIFTCSVISQSCHVKSVKRKMIFAPLAGWGNEGGRAACYNLQVLRRCDARARSLRKSLVNTLPAHGGPWLNRPQDLAKDHLTVASDEEKLANGKKRLLIFLLVARLSNPVLCYPTQIGIKNFIRLSSFQLVCLLWA